MSASSPKNSLGPSTRSPISSPSPAIMVILTAPLFTMNSASPGIFSVKILALGLISRSWKSPSTSSSSSRVLPLKSMVFCRSSRFVMERPRRGQGKYFKRVHYRLTGFVCQESMRDFASEGGTPELGGVFFHEFHDGIDDAPGDIGLLHGRQFMPS